MPGGLTAAVNLVGAAAAFVPIVGQRPVVLGQGGVYLGHDGLNVGPVLRVPGGCVANGARRVWLGGVPVCLLYTSPSPRD